MPERIERDEVRRLVEVEGARVVEVLPREDYDYEHIAGAISIPLRDLDREAARQLDRAKPVIVYCNDFL